MGDFGTALIFFVTFLLTAFMRSGDFGLALANNSKARGNPIVKTSSSALKDLKVEPVLGDLFVLGQGMESSDYQEAFNWFKKAAVGGIAIGACVLLLIAGSVLVSVSAAPETADAQLPMLALAQSRGIVWGYVYGVLLLLAMFGTALSSLVAFVSMLAAKSARISGHKNKFTALCALCMFLGSLFGFGDLIGVVYPIFGYCSSVFIVLMAY